MDGWDLSHRQVLHNRYRLEKLIQGVTEECASPGFWLKDTKDPDRVLMTETEIRRYNRRLQEKKDSPLTDLTSLDQEMAQNNRKSIVAYGLTDSDTALRSRPTLRPCIQKGDEFAFDRFAETTLKAGEGVWILDRSQDGSWLLVRGKNYSGWVPADSVVLCGRKEMIHYLTAEDFAVITCPAECFGKKGVRPLAMGCRLPRGTRPDTVLLPESGHGKLELTEWRMRPKTWVPGYLPYTTAFVLDQAMKLLNIPYGWGGPTGFLDCSSAMLAVYECFGFSLPRNTSQMTALMEGAIDVSGMDEAAKKARLSKTLPGSLLLLKGHVMMYLGMKDRMGYALHAFTEYEDENGTRQIVMQCTISPLSVRRVGGGSFLQEICRIVEIRPQRQR